MAGLGQHFNPSKSNISFRVYHCCARTYHIPSISPICTVNRCTYTSAPFPEIEQQSINHRSPSQQSPPALMDSMDDEHTSDAWLGDGGMAEVKVAIEKVPLGRNSLQKRRRRTYLLRYSINFNTRLPSQSISHTKHGSLRFFIL